MGPTRCSPVALGFKGSKRSSKLGPVKLQKAMDPVSM